MNHEGANSAETPKSRQIRELTNEVLQQKAFADPHLFQQAHEWKRQVQLMSTEHTRLHQRLEQFENKLSTAKQKQLAQKIQRTKLLESFTTTKKLDRRVHQMHKQELATKIASLEEDIVSARANHLSRHGTLLYHYKQMIHLAKRAKQHQRKHWRRQNAKLCAPIQLLVTNLAGALAKEQGLAAMLHVARHSERKAVDQYQKGRLVLKKIRAKNAALTTQLNSRERLCRLEAASHHQQISQPIHVQHTTKEMQSAQCQTEPTTVKALRPQNKDEATATERTTMATEQTTINADETINDTDAEQERQNNEPGSSGEQDSPPHSPAEKQPRALNAARTNAARSRTGKQTNTATPSTTTIMPPKLRSRRGPPKAMCQNIQESPIAKVQDSFSRKNRRKLLDLSLGTPVSIVGYSKPGRAKRRRRPRSSRNGEHADMFGNFLDHFQAPKLKAKRRKTTAPNRPTAASRSRAGMRHARRVRG